MLTPPPGFVLDTNPARLNLAAIHQYLSQESYWAQHIPLATVERAVANSLNFGIYAPDGQQAAFARVVSDRATFAWLCDVFVLPAYRGLGLSKWLVRSVLAHTELQGLRRHLLATLDAHGLYLQHGYRPLPEPSRWLEIRPKVPYNQ